MKHYFIGNENLKRIELYESHVELQIEQDNFIESLQEDANHLGEWYQDRGLWLDGFEDSYSGVVTHFLDCQETDELDEDNIEITAKIKRLPPEVVVHSLLKSYTPDEIAKALQIMGGVNDIL